MSLISDLDVFAHRRIRRRIGIITSITRVIESPSLDLPLVVPGFKPLAAAE